MRPHVVFVGHGKLKDEVDVQYGQFRVLFPIRKRFDLGLATYNTIEPLFAAKSADEARQVVEGMCRLRSSVLVSSNHAPSVANFLLPPAAELYKREARVCSP
jgi:hypothetical protein